MKGPNSNGKAVKAGPSSSQRNKHLLAKPARVNSWPLLLKTPLRISVDKWKISAERPPVAWTKKQASKTRPELQPRASGLSWRDSEPMYVGTKVCICMQEFKAPGSGRQFKP